MYTYNYLSGSPWEIVVYIQLSFFCKFTFLWFTFCFRPKKYGCMPKNTLSFFVLLIYMFMFYFVFQTRTRMFPFPKTNMFCFADLHVHLSLLFFMFYCCFSDQHTHVFIANISFFVFLPWARIIKNIIMSKTVKDAPLHPQDKRARTNVFSCVMLAAVTFHSPIRGG